MKKINWRALVVFVGAMIMGGWFYWWMLSKLFGGE